ncbi:Outer membrane protein MIP [Emticicia aquatica]|jgi:FKBP-type peptidyl-prolyl cis-trans isomerase FklB|uniref:Peptidyl-prolyl cis-trans isomerase n=1 Tax=Emticicia aquatica TaxID=1681835 RepID=A0ABM9ARC7_9BACT|nr:FKBP-type peptidyl-prolyl cis-trans isomerase [Emticicia aquatica]CAH0996508.1 Outer membrane protein MIP [Emticicia aquatica]
MKKTIIAFAASIFLTQFSYAQGTKTPVAKPKAPASKPVVANKVAVSTPSVSVDGMKNGVDSISYAIGMNIAGNLKQQNLKVNSEMMAKAIDQVLNGQPTWMEANAANVYIQSYFQNESMKKGAANLKVGEKFLAENKTKAGVVTLPSGLQYQIMKEASGAKPASSDKVRVHYHGTLIDGSVFDSSVERGQPAEFGVTQVIQGWVEALQLMPVGSKWKLFIPANLAYGPQGPPSIGPNQVLIFEVELLDIVK